MTISIHAPREGGDTIFPISRWICSISIHAPREGGDQESDSRTAAEKDFNPRPPRGGRRDLTPNGI